MLLSSVRSPLHLHLHATRTETAVGVFRYRTCRCGAVQLVWLTPRGARWVSAWGRDDEVHRELRRHVSHGRP